MAKEAAHRGGPCGRSNNLFIYMRQTDCTPPELYTEAARTSIEPSCASGVVWRWQRVHSATTCQAALPQRPTLQPQDPARQLHHIRCPTRSRLPRSSHPLGHHDSCTRRVGLRPPFAYAQIIGIFHADVVDNTAGPDTKPEPMQFLWVRRYRIDKTFRAGFKRKRLHRLSFLPDTDPNAFGFLNPDEVIRGAHIVPAFAHGTTDELLAPGSVGRLPREGLDDEDWKYYYVNW